MKEDNKPEGQNQERASQNQNQDRAAQEHARQASQGRGSVGQKAGEGRDRAASQERDRSDGQKRAEGQGDKERPAVRNMSGDQSAKSEKSDKQVKGNDVDHGKGNEKQPKGR